MHIAQSVGFISNTNYLHLLLSNDCTDFDVY